MKYFNNIHSLSELKKQYRALVIANHPDKGGSLEIMQQINEEFEQLFESWKDKKAEEQDTTGYAEDYAEASAQEYTQYVYEEYGWTGSRRDRNYTRKELKEIFTKWLKDTYKNCTFSVSLDGYRSIKVRLSKADFNPFKGNAKMIYRISRYSIDEDPELNDRAKEMFQNIESFCMSYNYDNSDIMTDYFDVGFYLDMEIGSSRTPFKIEIPKSRRASGACSAEFKYKEGPAHQAIKKALGKQYFADVVNYGLVLGFDFIYNDSISFNANHYSAPKTMRKKMDKLLSVGIITKAKYGCIVFVGYTPEVEKALAEEDRAKEEAFKAWQEKQRGENKEEKAGGTAAPEKEAEPAQQNQEVEEIEGFEIVGYSDKSLAVFGDTYSIREELKALGAKYNRSLKYGDGKRAGWVVSRSKSEELSALLTRAAYAEDEKKAGQLAGIIGTITEIIEQLTDELSNRKDTEKEITAEDMAQVFAALPEIIDQFAGLISGQHEQTECRKSGTAEEYNRVCRSAIESGSYDTASRQIRNAIKEYRFTLPQLKYMVYLLHRMKGREPDQCKAA